MIGFHLFRLVDLRAVRATTQGRKLGELRMRGDDTDMPRDKFGVPISKEFENLSSDELGIPEQDLRAMIEDAVAEALDSTVGAAAPTPTAAELEAIERMWLYQQQVERSQSYASMKQSMSDYATKILGQPLVNTG